MLELKRNYRTSLQIASIANKLSKLNPNTASGPFDPNVKLIKTFAQYFAEPLSYIFNESFICIYLFSSYILLMNNVNRYRLVRLYI